MAKQFQFCIADWMLHVDFQLESVGQPAAMREKGKQEKVYAGRHVWEASDRP